MSLIQIGKPRPIIHTKPKFFWLLKIFFPSADWDSGVIITYGQNIYCKQTLPYSLVMHEITHMNQQRNSAIIWWIKYVLSPSFRLSQELEAHRAEYQATTGDRNTRNRALHMIAERLSGSLYNNLITKQEAINLIQQ